MTISTGNWAQGLAWYAQKLGIKCTILVPDSIPKIKEDAIKRYKANVIKLLLEIGIEILYTRKFNGMDGYFIHPFSDQNIMAGNGTIGLEILEDLSDVDAIIVPWGGGGLACGIASTIRSLKTDIKVYAAEIDTCKPLALAFDLGAIPKQIPHKNSFVESIGYPFLLPEMWELAENLLDGSIVVTLEESVETIRLLVDRNSVIAE